MFVRIFYANMREYIIEKAPITEENTSLRNSKKTSGITGKSWDNLLENEKEIVLYLIHLTPPVSIDTHLVGLNGFNIIKAPFFHKIR